MKKQSDYKLVRITRKAAGILENFTAKQNANGAMRVNASHFISEAIVLHCAKFSEKSSA